MDEESGNARTAVQAGKRMTWRPRYDALFTYPVTVVEARSGNVLIEFENGEWNLTEYGELEEREAARGESARR